MKPLLAKDLPAFLKRFGNFVDGEFRDLEIISPTIMKLTLAGQDWARGFDWLSIEFEFNNINDANILDNSKLLHVDMEDGINIVYQNNQYKFILNNSTFHIHSQNIKYQEKQF